MSVNIANNIECIQHIYFQQQEYLKFEERITKGILCPFTMVGSHSLFQQYWKVMLSDSYANNPLGGDGARERYQKYYQIIQNAIEEQSKTNIGQDNKDVDSGNGEKSFHDEL